MGKGSRRRPEVNGNYGQNYEKIFGQKKGSEGRRKEDATATQEKAVAGDEQEAAGGLEE